MIPTYHSSDLSNTRLRQHPLDLSNIIDTSVGRCIPAIRDGMKKNVFQTSILCAFHQWRNVTEMTVDTTVRNKAKKVQGRSLTFHIGEDILNLILILKCIISNRLINPYQIVPQDAAGTDGHVSYFRVTDDTTRQAHCLLRSIQRGPGTLFEQPIKCRCAGQSEGVVLLGIPESQTIQDNEDKFVRTIKHGLRPPSIFPNEPPRSQRVLSNHSLLQGVRAVCRRTIQWRG